MIDITLAFQRPPAYYLTMKNKVIFIVLFLALIVPASTFAVEVVPRISDREIVEKLARLEAGQEALRSEMKSGLGALSKRIDDLNSMMLTLFSAMVALILALFAYIAWYRRTMLKPVVERLDHLEKVVMHDLEISSPEGSKLSRLIHAMRELAKTDKKVESVMRAFSLL